MLPLPVSIEYRDGYFVYASSSYLPLSESEMENAAPSAWKERGIHAGSGVESQGGPWGSTTHAPPPYRPTPPPPTIKFFFLWAPLIKILDPPLTSYGSVIGPCLKKIYFSFFRPFFSIKSTLILIKSTLISIKRIFFFFHFSLNLMYGKLY